MRRYANGMGSVWDPVHTTQRGHSETMAQMWSSALRYACVALSCDPQLTRTRTATRKPGMTSYHGTYVHDFMWTGSSMAAAMW